MTFMTIKCGESRRRNHLHLESELQFKKYYLFKANVLDRPEVVIGNGLSLKTVKVTTNWSSLHN